MQCEMSQGTKTSELQGQEQQIPQQEVSCMKKLESKMECCPLRDLDGLAKELPPQQFKISSRVNDLSPQEKRALQQIAGAHGYSQRPEYTIPFSRRIYRCGWEGCRATINPNGVEKATRSHFRKMHNTHPRAIQITLDRHDGKQMCFLIPRGAKCVVGKPKEKQPAMSRGALDPEHEEKEKEPETPKAKKDRATTEDYEGHMDLESIGTPEHGADEDEPKPGKPLDGEEGRLMAMDQHNTVMGEDDRASKTPKNLPTTMSDDRSELRQLEYLNNQLPRNPTEQAAGDEQDANAAEQLGPTEDVPQVRRPQRQSGPDGTRV